MHEAGKKTESLRKFQQNRIILKKNILSYCLSVLKLALFLFSLEKTIKVYKCLQEMTLKILNLLNACLLGLYSMLTIIS